MAVASKMIKAILWDGEGEEAFKKLKKMCTSNPILAYTNFSKSLKLHTDVCNLGLGAILYENPDGNDWAIGYVSRALSKT